MTRKKMYSNFPGFLLYYNVLICVHREEWIVMQLELTEKEFRRLLDMVYIGNWILNSCWDDDRFEDYDNLE